MKKRIEKRLIFLKNIKEKGFFHLLSANVLIQVVAFASQLFVAGILSPEDVGRIKIIQTFLSIFSIIGGMGFNASTLKLCSENITKEERQKLFNAATVFTLTTTIILYITILILNSISIFTSDKLIKLLIPIGMLPLVTNSIFILFVSYFQAIKEIKIMSNLTMINKLLSIAAIMLLTYFWGIKGYYIAYNLGVILMLILSYRLVHKRNEIDFKPDYKLFKIHWKYAKKSTFANLFSEISAYLDIILINIFITDMRQIGMYSFALTLIIILRLFPATVQQMASPYFSSLSNNKESFITAFKRYNKILYVVVFLSFILAIIFVPPIVDIIFNGKYKEAMPFFNILAIGWSIRQLIQLQSGAIFGIGKIEYNAYISLITVIVNLLIYPILMYYYGIMGAAYGSIFSGVTIFIASYFYSRKAIKQM